MPRPKATTGRTTIAVSRDRLLALHQTLRVIDGQRASLGKPSLNLRSVLDILISLTSTNYIQQLLVNFDKTLDLQVPVCFNNTNDASATTAK